MAISKNNFKVVSLTIKDIVSGTTNEALEEMIFDIEHPIAVKNNEILVQPEFQRSYIHNTGDKWCKKLIWSILKNNPIGIIHFSKGTEPFKYNVVDGQQRIITILSFFHNLFHIEIDGNKKTFFSLNEEMKESFLNYALNVYCIDSENKDDIITFFEDINQPNATLTQQELRNSMFGGNWLKSLQKNFVQKKNNPFAKTPSKKDTSTTKKHLNENKYLLCRYIEQPNENDYKRQSILEIVLDWVSSNDTYRSIKDKDERIKKFMSDNYKNIDATEVINTYHDICDWIWDLFCSGEHTFDCRGLEGTPHCFATKSTNQLNIGELYFKYKNRNFSEEDKKYFNEKLFYYNSHFKELGIKKKVKIIEFLLESFDIRDNEEEYNKLAVQKLQLRTFDKDEKQKMFELQGGIDPISDEKLDWNNMEAHHITSFKNGGTTTLDNCVLVNKTTHIDYIHSGEISKDILLHKRNVLILQKNPTLTNKEKAIYGLYE